MFTIEARRLYESANRASADAIRFRQDDPRLARLRRQDAATLRRLARASVQAPPAT